MALRLVKAVPESVVIRGHTKTHHLGSQRLDFPGRDESIASAAAGLVATLEESFKDDATRDPGSVLLDGTEALVRHFVEHPAHLRLELHDSENRGGLWTVCARDQRIMGAWSQRLFPLEGLLARGRLEGVFRTLEATDLYRVMVGGSMLHILGYRADERLGPSQERLFELSSLVRELVERYMGA